MQKTELGHSVSKTTGSLNPIYWPSYLNSTISNKTGRIKSCGDKEQLCVSWTSAAVGVRGMRRRHSWQSHVAAQSKSLANFWGLQNYSIQQRIPPLICHAISWDTLAKHTLFLRLHVSTPNQGLITYWHLPKTESNVALFCYSTNTLRSLRSFLARNPKQTSVGAAQCHWTQFNVEAWKTKSSSVSPELPLL